MVSSTSAVLPRRPLTITPASVIIICVAALVSIGLAVLFSASSPIKGGPYYSYLYKQLIFLALAIGAAWLVALADLEQLRRFAWIAAAVALVTLVLVLIPQIGVSVKGSRRWLNLGFTRLQVSEFAKLALVFSLAHYLALNQSKLHDFWRGFVIPAAWTGLFALLVLAEPDFGTAFLLGTIGMILLFLAGARLKFLLPAIGAALLAFVVLVLHNPVRLRRITSFMDIEANRGDGAYQLWQAILAFAAGGVDGVGLGQGRQQNSFLPEAHTDFIFAIMGEEMGLIFTLLTVALFVTIFVAGLMHVRRAPNLFQFLLVTGCLLLICLQAIINLGVVTGMLPTKGMSLPFISAGGSNLLLMGLLVGVIINTQRTWERPKPLVRKRALTEVIG
ncbi:putative lipid II flippase FtsW [Oleiharenicola lentus]|uniref:Probable peptidoglycan glycosyltransferase FtsW n=1 Tax=Oleiharenicola lentus TaxID=2508720 RepID=A0A4Q1CCZ1_9BACT|nr:putative lipid II flippase FtsW [Oleiharenicola lentus]RXK56831.1 putative lipid II flippase FtsW [Oleiharenicola lentus]